MSVYEEDDEALQIWRDHIGVAPERIKRMGAADNFWASGPTGEVPGVHVWADWDVLDLYGVALKHLHQALEGQGRLLSFWADRSGSHVHVHVHTHL